MKALKYDITILSPLNGKKILEKWLKQVLWGWEWNEFGPPSIENKYNTSIEHMFLF